MPHATQHIKKHTKHRMIDVFKGATCLRTRCFLTKKPPQHVPPGTWQGQWKSKTGRTNKSSSACPMWHLYTAGLFPPNPQAFACFRSPTQVHHSNDGHYSQPWLQWFMLYPSEHSRKYYCWNCNYNNSKYSVVVKRSAVNVTAVQYSASDSYSCTETPVGICTETKPAWPFACKSFRYIFNKDPGKKNRRCTCPGASSFVLQALSLTIPAHMGPTWDV